MAFCTVTGAKEAEAVYFDVEDIGEPGGDVPEIGPWKVVELDVDYGGQWVVCADLDNDGEAEIVSCENVNIGDVHYTSTAVAQELDGSVLWRWGDAGPGRKKWHHDVACQIHDWDGDGLKEVVLCTKGAVVELDGRTGKERRRIKIADDATDCLVFCNLSGGNRPTDILVKNRYRQIWAYDRKGKLLWTVTNPGGYRTAHQARPMDIDGDGRDEIMAGYAMLNYDGSVRWVFKSEKVDQKLGHLDCARIYRKGKSPEEFRIVLTCCGANNIAMIDGTGEAIWEVVGHHFESIDVGRVLPDGREAQIVVDIDHRPLNESPLWLMDRFGNLLGQIISPYCRHHSLLDWTGDGAEEMLVSHNGAIYNHKGRRIGTFTTPGKAPTAKGERSMLIGDMTGDGVGDVMIVTPKAVYIYENTKGKKQAGGLPIGTEFNFTLY
jgi:hypothetical protein